MSLTMIKPVPLHDGTFRSEVTDLEPEGYWFEIGDKVKFTGLIDNPQFNGTKAVIRDYRPCSPSQYCPSGRAYYLVDGTPWGDDWVYQERLVIDLSQTPATGAK